MKSIITIIIVGAVALGIIYSLSAPAKQKVNRAYEDFTEWTPERKVEDPKGYLDHVERETQSVMKNLDASQVAISGHWAQFDRERNEISERIAAGREALDELKATYRRIDADEDLGFPHPFRGAMRGETWYRESIVKLAQALEEEEMNAGYISAALDRLTSETRKVERLRAAAGAELRNVQLAQRELQIDKVSQGIESRLAEVESFLAAMKGVVTLDAAKRPLTLNELVEKKRHEKTFGDEAFEKAMKK